MKSILAVAAALTTSAFSATPLPKIIAHRGASHDAPENTIASFKRAWEQNADGIEGDFYLTTDNRVVCIHDKTTKRTAGTDVKVVESSYSDLAKLDVGAWKGPDFKGEKIPTLEDVLGGVPPGKYFFVEIKDGPRIVGPIAEILRRKNADPKQVILISFDAEVVKACREQIPAHQAYLITSLKDFGKPGKPEAELAALDACGGQGLLFKSTVPVTKEWFAAAKSGGRTMFCWNVDEPVLGRKMIDLGVDFMGSNRPGFVRSELAK